MSEVDNIVPLFKTAKEKPKKAALPINPNQQSFDRLQTAILLGFDSAEAVRSMERRNLIFRCSMPGKKAKYHRSEIERLTGAPLQLV